MKMMELTPSAPNADAVKYRISTPVSKLIIVKAKAYLEAAFLKFVKNTVYSGSTCLPLIALLRVTESRVLSKGSSTRSLINN